MTYVARVMALALASTFAAGCVSFSMFQGPEAIDQGRLVGGIGASMFSAPGDTADDEGLIGPLPELGVRYGLGSGFDLGVKFAGVPPFGTVYGDVRWQLTDSPVPVTAGLGASHVSWDTGDPDRLTFSALYPSVAVGTDRLWVAGRGIVIAFGSADELFLSDALWGLVVGTAFGDGLRLLPELEVYFGPDDALWGLGLGLQFGLHDPDDGG